MLRERRLELGGFRTRALELAGDRDREASSLLLLHGWSDSADTWRPLLSRLARRGRHALALDMPGFGQADRVDRDQAVLPQLDRFLAAAIAHVSADGGGAPVVVAGNSLGGLAAMRAAQNAEPAIAAIAPIAPAGLEMARWFPIVESAPLVRMILRAPLPLPEVVVRESVGRVYRALAFARPAEVDPTVISSFTRHVRSRRDVIRVLATGRRLLGEIRDPFQLERIRCPVLLIWGADDRMVFSSGAERVLDEIPHARLELIESCGHCPQIEAADRVAELLDEFPGSLAAAA